MEGAALINADIRGVTFSRAKLRAAVLFSVAIWRANFEKAVTTEVSAKFLDKNKVPERICKEVKSFYQPCPTPKDEYQWLIEHLRDALRAHQEILSEVEQRVWSLDPDNLSVNTLEAVDTVLDRNN
jgi:hypothetical protein